MKATLQVINQMQAGRIIGKYAIDGAMVGDFLPGAIGHPRYLKVDAVPRRDIAFTRDLRSAVSTLTMETGRPLAGQAAPFILTRNCRELEKGT